MSGEYPMGGISPNPSKKSCASWRSCWEGGDSSMGTDAGLTRIVPKIIVKDERRGLIKLRVIFWRAWNIRRPSNNVPLTLRYQTSIRRRLSRIDFWIEQLHDLIHSIRDIKKGKQSIIPN